MRRLLFSLLLCCPLACLAGALTIRVCISDRPFAPLTMPDGSGQVQELMRRAARGLPLAVSYVMAERRQCLAKLRDGAVDAALTAYLPERQEYASYPMLGEQPDEASALAVARYMVFRRRGGTLNWDGRQFSDLGEQPVGIQPGCLYGVQLRQMGVVVDESSSSSQQNLTKLVQNRVAAVIGQEGEGAELIAQQFRGQVDMLPQPFRLTPQYLVFNKRFYERNQAGVAAYWHALRQQRESADYQRYLRYYPAPPR